MEISKGLEIKRYILNKTEDAVFDLLYCDELKMSDLCDYMNDRLRLIKENNILRQAMFDIEYCNDNKHCNESGLLKSQKIAIDCKYNLIKLKNKDKK